MEGLICLSFKAAYLSIMLRLGIAVLLLVFRFQMVDCVHIQVDSGVVVPLLLQALLARLVIDLGYAPMLIPVLVFVVRLFQMLFA